ncbi:hypothetical protein X777_10439 [Ooceraea biroi]|uniref:Double jelly roll-like domain-containing protein n=1 Tax=Ooceraea biroi TaxID=2015173 RepID=A0A026W4Y8_OOCBI|nr:hypothetical protein X777_10439 [Ooceraea biroi]
MRAGCVIDIPRAIQVKRAVVNVRAKDNACFAWAVVAALYPSATHADRTVHYPDYTTVLDVGGIEFPMTLDQIGRFERGNDISINLFAEDDDNRRGVIVPLRLTDRKRDRHVNLLYVPDSHVEQPGHFAWIRDLSRLVSAQCSRKQHRKYICDRCLHYFPTEKRLAAHIIDCESINDCAIVLPSEDDKLLAFRNYKRKERTPFVVYADLEYTLEKNEQAKDAAAAGAYQRHRAFSVGNTTFGHSDEIRIPMQQQDLYTLPCESYLYIEGTFSVDGAAAEGDVQAAPDYQTHLVNNCAAFLFNELRYELNGVEIDRSRNVGVTNTLKNYVFLTHARSNILLSAGWSLTGTSGRRLQTRGDQRMGFCEDYRRVVINARHELVLIRARNDNNCIVLSGDRHGARIDLHKVQWRMPHVYLNEINKLRLLRTLESGRFLSMAFHSWDLYEFPLLQSTTAHSWAVKAATQLEKPRKDASLFDACDLSNVKLFLNSTFYPYDNMHLDFAKNRYALLYDMYARFRRAYYALDRNDDGAVLTMNKFLHCGPFVVLDCSRQNETVKSATVDVGIEFDCRRNVPPETTAYCLILHDRVVEYIPLTSVVRRVV